MGKEDAQLRFEDFEAELKCSQCFEVLSTMELPFTVARQAMHQFAATSWDRAETCGRRGSAQAPVHSLGCLESGPPGSGRHVSNLRESLHDLVVWRMGGPVP